MHIDSGEIDGRPPQPISRERVYPPRRPPFARLRARVRTESGYVLQPTPRLKNRELDSPSPPASPLARAGACVRTERVRVHLSTIATTTERQPRRRVLTRLL